MPGQLWTSSRVAISESLREPESIGKWVKKCRVFKNIMILSRIRIVTRKKNSKNGKQYIMILYIFIMNPEQTWILHVLDLMICLVPQSN